MPVLHLSKESRCLRCIHIFHYKIGSSPLDCLTDKEKVEDENDNVDCTVPTGVSYSMCCHFVPAMESDSVSNNESKSSPSHEGVALAHKTKTSKQRNLFIDSYYCHADPHMNNTKRKRGPPLDLSI